MAYITNQDIIDRVGDAKTAQLSLDSGNVANPASPVLDEVRLSTEGEVNAYLAKRYATPVDLVEHPELEATLKGFALDVAAYRLHARRPPVPDEVRRMRDDALAWLMKVAGGDVLLPAETAPESTNADGPLQGWGGSARVSSRENIV